ncbi:PREDICTED: vacuolar fusion protein CCZ1 homolog [Rhagoletis zephyria]|uniref:vacuolar fusion protein CCZ1 homolog n=1 Tax=Rhagoletis zephyria TaxID=28612 RepID=UPI000811666F|nr:PREDICTED: vacuolar fusion protein CCZ1 homolog [Rhagoletis zephyria]KAH9408657.1 vacuolar fusion protein ccz1 [Tyrophagus putrescentiae]
MSQVKVRHTFSLVKYFVFNTDWGKKEGTEHEKLIYYFSKGPASPDQQVSDIGLAEAVINFGQQFGDIAESLHGSKLRFVFFDLSPTIWSTICISEPFSVHKSNDDNTQFHEYHDNEVNNKFFKLKLQNIYRYFCLLNGPIEKLCAEVDRTAFIERCTQFFDSYIPHLELLPFNLIELYSSIQYLPLSNTTFMAVQSLLNCVQATDSRIKSYIFLYNDQLVSSLLSLQDTQTLYNYLTNVIIPEAVKEEINGISNKTRWLQKNLKVYFSGEQEFRSLCLFRSINGSTIGLVLDNYDENILQECEALLSGRLVSLTGKLHETVTQLAKQPEMKITGEMAVKDIKFIYINNTNCAQRGNSNGRKVVDSDFSRLILDMEADLEMINNENHAFELIGKNTSDSWLVTRSSDLRTLFAVLNHKNANLIEATEMIEVLNNKHLKNIFFGV